MHFIHRVLRTAIWFILLPASMRSTLADDVNPTKLPVAPLTRIHARSSEPTRILPDGREAHGGLLVRELVRQAVLIAARDEMGLPTRDSSLEDKIGSKDPNALEIQTTCDPSGKVLIALTLGQKWQSDWTYETEVSYSPIEGLVNYRELSEKLEQLSRTKIPGVLQSVRFSKQSLPERKNVFTIDPKIAGNIQRLSPLSQLTAIRRLHSIARKEGESPELLEALAQSYAHLAMLTQRHLSCQTVVFAARALLYSSRLSALYPNTTRGAWTQAYVLGLIGADGTALLTMEDAEKQALKLNEAIPEWKVPLECKCKYDYHALKKWRSNQSDSNEVFDYLYFQSAGGSEWFGCTTSMDIAREFVRKRHAGCTPIARSLTSSQSINDQEDVFRRLEPFLKEEIASQIGTWDDIPALVKRALATDNPVKFVPKALVNIALAINSGEPSARSIGRLILEYRILSAYDRFSYLSKAIHADYSQEKDRFWNEAQDHPLMPVALLGAIHEGASRDYLQQYYSKLPVNEPRISDVILLRSLIGVKVDNRDLGQEYLNEARWHMDDLNLDYLLMSRLLQEDEKRTLAERWLRVSPYRPAATFITQYPGDNGFTEHNPSWIQNAESHPETLHPLVDWLLRHQEYEAAIPVLTKAITHTPDPYFYLSLATVRKRLGEIDEWRETLEELIKQPEHDERHASAQCEIAQYYMELKQFDAALPYALAAARVNSARALRCVAYCEEGLGHNAEAIAYFNKMTKRHPFWGMEWYLACVRLNSKELEAAKSFVDELHSGYSDGNLSVVYEANAMIAFCEGKPELAAENLEKAFKILPSGYLGLMAALTYGEIQRPADSKRVLQETIAKAASWSRNFEASKNVARLIQDDINQRGNNPLSDESINDALSEVEPGNKLDFIYLVALYFDQTGRKEKAKAYFEEISEKFYYRRYVSTLARERLRRSTKGE